MFGILKLQEVVNDTVVTQKTFTSLHYLAERTSLG